MTGIWPPAELPGIHIDAGVHTSQWAPERGHWIRVPAADYRCARCSWTSHASGDAVAAFAEITHQTHQLTCPHHEETAGS